MNNPNIPEGMKPWHGGHNAPSDWDGGKVLWQIPFQGDEMGRASADPDDWSHRHAWPKIIAYTPHNTIESGS